MSTKTVNQSQLVVKGNIKMNKIEIRDNFQFCLTTEAFDFPCTCRSFWGFWVVLMSLLAVADLCSKDENDRT